MASVTARPHCRQNVADIGDTHRRQIVAHSGEILSPVWTRHYSPS